MSWNVRTRRISSAFRMLWKRTLSYRKHHREFSDYPVVVRLQKDVPSSDRYWARILGWNVDATGETEPHARRKLEELFVTQRAARIDSGKPVPRPGTHVPIEFASQERVSAQNELMEDFIHRVLDLRWAFLSDESSLMHFAPDGKIDAPVARIKDVYGVDVSDVADGNIAEILERIALRRAR